MARIGISITMSVPFRNSTQEFSNVVYYDGLSATPSFTDANNLIDELVTKLRPLYSAGVSFVRGRLWLQTGSEATTEMLSQKTLTGTGSGGAISATMDRERAYLFRLRAGVDSRGNPVYLRKWIHACFDLGGVSTTGGIQTNASGFTTSQRATLEALVSGLGSCGSGPTQGAICAKGGRLPTAGATWSAHQFLEHHQLGDQWRAQ
jgi:hypothetical protein